MSFKFSKQKAPPNCWVLYQDSRASRVRSKHFNQNTFFSNLAGPGCQNQSPKMAFYNRADIVQVRVSELRQTSQGQVGQVRFLKIAKNGPFTHFPALVFTFLVLLCLHFWPSCFGTWTQTQTKVIKKIIVFVYCYLCYYSIKNKIWHFKDLVFNLSALVFIFKIWHFFDQNFDLVFSGLGIFGFSPLNFLPKVSL